MGFHYTMLLYQFIPLKIWLKIKLASISWVPFAK